MQNKIDLINSRLKSLFKVEEKPHKILYEALNYTFSTKAKRLRPLLTLLICDSYKFDITKALDAAIAIELIHIYSLIHDDLPSMDNDDLRRGKPTLHKKYSEWLAILSGDALLTCSFELLSNIVISDEKKIKLIKTLSRYAGKDNLIAGQIVDLQSENKRIDFDTLKFMHINKTSSLFIAAAIFGAVLSSAPKEDVENLKSFASNLGLAFQIRDDLLDVESTSENLGKTANSDIDQNKSTAVNILGLDKAKKIEKELFEKASISLNSLSIDSHKLKNFIEILLNRNN